MRDHEEAKQSATGKLPTMATSDHAVSPGARANRWRTLLQIISIVIAVEVALHAAIVKEPLVTIVVALVWLGGAFWVRFGARGGPILIGVLSVFELVGTVAFRGEVKAGTTNLLLIDGIHVVLVAIALVAVVMTLRVRHRDVASHSS